MSACRLSRSSEPLRSTKGCSHGSTGTAESVTNVICDLDGVLYKGDSPIQGAAQALARLIDAGVDVTFVTNNSTRSPGGHCP